MQQGWAGAKAIASRLSVSLLCVVSICFLFLVYNEFAQGPISFYLVYYLVFTTCSSEEPCP